MTAQCISTKLIVVVFIVIPILFHLLESPTKYELENVRSNTTTKFIYNEDDTHKMDEKQLNNKMKEISSRISHGGAHKPEIQIFPGEKTCIVIPYRNRQFQLRIFLLHMHKFLIKQGVNYEIIVSEQVDKELFNRGLLMNAAYIEIKKLNLSCNCYIFHDVDTLPVNLDTNYSCKFSPIHFSAFMSKFGYKIPYNNFFGGIFAMKAEEIERINGFPNRYRGWGGEDDDIYRRIYHFYGKPYSYSNSTGRFQSIVLDHKQDSKKFVSAAYEINYAIYKMKSDGLSTLKYNLKNISYNAYYTKIQISVNYNNM